MYGALAAGAVAGMTVEATLFPLDCVKTRVQSGVGFAKAGGFKSIYRGVGVTAVGAVPASAIFFCTYEHMKERYGSALLASLCGELAASSVRVPVDMVKQRMQAGLSPNFASAAYSLASLSGRQILVAFRISAARDATHSGLQYPLYEHLKIVAARRSRCQAPEDLPLWLAASCGSAAGAASALGDDTPLDLLRTRLNLRATSQSVATSKDSSSAIMAEIRNLASGKDGTIGVIRTLFAGAGYRSIWMGLGGFVFLGSFEFAKKQIEAVGRSASMDMLPAGGGVGSYESCPSSCLSPSTNSSGIAEGQSMCEHTSDTMVIGTV
eukprot:CAMPEP_0206432982 /NCGR_PEP_ID=MMETSP0324_2-20121206/8268_1 /ASSEMBLY_ACC=CAM_ASM_000836 /TAXON_ID=2866 /ORGANISM="Crypthecodinium cohnii, Strain Seligo" /LENGTH=322 /DNA_ID=CAMNT_0053899173 /DNA_START=78 /DNA_END=1046 /DNA_ORIENTATION=-